MISTNDNMVMPVSPMMGYGNGNVGFGGDWSMWLVLLILFCGWGGNGFGGGFGNNQLSYDFPWLMSGQNNINANTNNGFRDALINDGINGIQNSLISGFAGVNSSICNASNDISQQLYTTQIADMNQRFTDTLTMNNQMNNLAASLQNCCCENRASTQDLKYTLATEACATRNTDTLNTQNILTAITGGIQSIKDQMCQDKIDAKNDTIEQLRSELLYARGQASQVAQTAAIEQYVRPTPGPAYIVSNPYCNYNQNYGCGCGCGVA